MALNKNGKKLMNRSEFREKFHSSGPVILPVIHVIDSGQTAANIDKLITAGIKGCFLINHDFDVETFLPIIRSIRATYPDFWLGLNFLGVTGLDAFPVLASLSDEGCRIDAYWADDARIDERTDDQSEADAIADMLKNCGWQGLYFGGTAFKKQRPVNPGDYTASARIAGGYMDVVTTSGVATGNAADLGKIATFREALPDKPIALASGITPENAADYSNVDCFMVATGINIDQDFYNIDPAKLDQLMMQCDAMEKQK